MMRSYRTRGIVLGRVNLGETDRIVTLFSRERGKISAVAKGARRIKSSLAASTEMGSYSTLQIAMGANLDIISQAELKTAFLGLRASLERISRALYVLEFCQAFLEDRQPHPDLFDLLLSALYSLENGHRLDWIVTGFELQAMVLLGYAPQIQVCVACGKPPGSGAVRFSPSLGGIICPDCGPRNRESMRVNQAALETMSQIVYSELPTLGAEAARENIEVRRLVRAHVRQRAEREMKSARFVEQLRAEMDVTEAGSV